MNVESTKFRKPVFPNEKIMANVKALRSKGRVWRFEGKSINENGETVCNSHWSAMIMDKKMNNIHKTAIIQSVIIGENVTI